MYFFYLEFSAQEKNTDKPSNNTPTSGVEKKTDISSNIHQNTYIHICTFIFIYSQLKCFYFVKGCWLDF